MCRNGQVANVLADSSPGWDINSKTGSGEGESENYDTINETIEGYTNHCKRLLLKIVCANSVLQLRSHLVSTALITSSIQHVP